MMARHSSVLSLMVPKHSFYIFSIFSLGFLFLWTRVPQLAALALHSSPKVGLVRFFLILQNALSWHTSIILKEYVSTSIDLIEVLLIWLTII